MNLTDQYIIATIRRSFANGETKCAFTVKGEVNLAASSEGPTRYYRPPTEWVALAGPCETCGGIGGFEVIVDGDPCRHGTCRSCGKGLVNGEVRGDGRKRVTFTRTEDRLLLGENMPRRVPLVSAAVEVLPVIAGVPGFDAEPGGYVVQLNGGSSWNQKEKPPVFYLCRVGSGSRMERLELREQPTPGQDFVVVLDGMVAL
jgi:hypothetical protein